MELQLENRKKTVWKYMAATRGEFPIFINYVSLTGFNRIL
jgi:hypothetical protein